MADFDSIIAAAQRGGRSKYIRNGLKIAGYSSKLADLADLMRGDRNSLELDMTEPDDRQAAEWFVKLLADQQRTIRVVDATGNLPA
jgi:hypothetical protein